MKQSRAIHQFQKLYWDDLTPEQINYLGQTEHEVAQLEKQVVILRKLFVEVGESVIEKDTVLRLTKIMEILRKVLKAGGE